MRSGGNVDSDVGFAKSFDKLIYLPKVVVAALIQCVEEDSNFDRLGALYEQFKNGISTRAIVADFDVLINNLEIGVIFLSWPRDLFEKGSCHFVHRLCCRLFQVEVNINWEYVRLLQVFDSSGPGLSENSKSKTHVKFDFPAPASYR
jgi:hypothetical protein